MIKQQEGLRLKAYKDSEGRLTIGYGRDISDVGISEQEADYLLANSLDIAIEDAEAIFSNFSDLSDNRKAALVDMAYNLGRTTLSSFIQFRQYIESEDWTNAATDMLNTLWSKQVGQRAQVLALMIRTG
jgi:lysozyme